MDIFKSLQKAKPLLKVAKKGFEALFNHWETRAEEIPDFTRHNLSDGDFLTVSGQKVYNRLGQQVLLRGTNAGGWLVHEEWMCPAKVKTSMEWRDIVTERFGAEEHERLLGIWQDRYWQEEDFDRCAEIGMNCLRLPFLYMNLADDEGNLKEDAFRRLDWFVENAGKRGLYVILDMHGAFGSQNGEHHSGQENDGRQLFFNAENRRKTTVLWTQIAAHFRGNPVVAGYDILNEPMGPGFTKARTGKVQWDYFNELYNAIRSADPEHIVIIEAVWVAFHLPPPSRYGWENIIYEYHFYAWGLGHDAVCAGALTAAAFWLPKVLNHGVPTLIGEVNCFGMAELWEDTLKYLTQLRFHWTTWTYKTNCSGWSIHQQDLTPTDVRTASVAEMEEAWSKTGTENAVPTMLKAILTRFLSD
ncbi:MAG: glycoside hydrolase family 5 protein [Oscillospiraceae bacterium]|jgi:hypothetical protein|nr:glycoside hydrolase family 5 protein [Oscillospiraceae bacterium]